MNKNQEEIRSEEERVESFMQAVQRMHDDPAEAARIDTIIEDAEHPVDDISCHDQPLVVHIHNEGGHNVVDLTPSHPDSRKEPEPSTSPRQEKKRKRSHSFNLQPLTAIPALVLMAVVVVTSMGYASQMVWSVLATSFMAVSAAQIWLSERFNFRVQRLEADTQRASIDARRKETQELNSH